MTRINDGYKAILSAINEKLSKQDVQIIRCNIYYATSSCKCYCTIIVEAGFSGNRKTDGLPFVITTVQSSPEFIAFLLIESQYAISIFE